MVHISVADHFGFEKEKKLDQPNTAQVKLRLSQEVRDALKSRAVENRRTLIREIEYRLIESLKRKDAHGANAAA